ncbi:N-acetylmuramoyl-L-alanine amidase [Staphylococcus felis]|uniref:N-acetylmuramoyl-L-alanine amidase n=1 Tax=Staphylococcus felis TaxID=46127 RepID=UPI000E28CB65|nr:N-acetylmuramoyl-L-alanine amidase [Staphylococcus felis]REI16741.1 amidase [Staphylococcus felis]
MITKEQSLKWIRGSEGKQYNVDNYYGFQCYDYANAYFKYVTGYTLKGLYAKNIHIDNKEILSEIATVYENTDSFLPEPGDIVIFNSHYGNGAGHVAVVTQATLSQFEVLEQNWNGGGWTDGVTSPGWGPERVTRRWHYYDNPMYFIRLKFANKQTLKQKIKTASKSNKPVDAIKKKRIMLVAGHGYNDPGAIGNGTNERDFIRKYITPNIAKYLRAAGHEVALYGGSKQNQDMYQDTAYGVRLGDTSKYGIYWVKSQKYDVVLEIHLDAAGESASGGHVIISSSLQADAIDKNIQSVIKDTVGQIRDIDGRNNLLNVNVAKEINVNYRLSELGFITSKKDMDWIKKNYKTYSKLIAGAIHGKPINGLPASSKKVSTKNDKKPVVPTGYKLDKNGVPYKKERGKYTVTTVKGNNVRKGYNLNSEITGVLKNGQNIIYDGAYVFNGYRWITYMSKNGRRYIATGKADARGNRVDSYGKFSKA